MLALACVVAALLTSCDARLSREKRKELEAKSHNNTWLLFSERHTYHLLYRSNENDSFYGGNAPCVHITSLRCYSSEMLTWNQLFFKRVEKYDLYTEKYIWAHMEKFRKNFAAYDKVTFEYHLPEISGEEDFLLLFTDYRTCFTLRRLADKVHQVWMIDTKNETGIHANCHSAYEGVFEDKTGSGVKTRYYIYNEAICK
uniref:Putative salivary lipocalin n=1 Tax=Ixodes ricinus TaxID=34613 RepID=A0A0K8RGJ8_IXORI